jgi:hypothetical protein
MHHGFKYVAAAESPRKRHSISSQMAILPASEQIWGNQIFGVVARQAFRTPLLTIGGSTLLSYFPPLVNRNTENQS